MTEAPLRPLITTTRHCASSNALGKLNPHTRLNQYTRLHMVATNGRGLLPNQSCPWQPTSLHYTIIHPSDLYKSLAMLLVKSLLAPPPKCYTSLRLFLHCVPHFLCEPKFPLVPNSCSTYIHLSKSYNHHNSSIQTLPPDMYPCHAALPCARAWHATTHHRIHALKTETCACDCSRA